MKNRWQFVISLLILLLTTAAGVMHQIIGGGPEGFPSTDALCAFGGMETLYSLITGGTYLNRIEPSSLILLIATIVLTLVLGRAFCGYICPLGTIQDLLSKLSRKLRIRQIKVNKGLDKILRFAKYIVLILVLFTTFKAGELVIRAYDPWAAYMHISSGAGAFDEFLVGFLLLAGIIISSLFIERAWCRYLCPFGATLALIAPLSIFKVKRNSTKCVGCKACTRNCPVGLDVDKTEIPEMTECISCGQCVSSCHITSTLEIKSKNSVMSLNKYAISILAIIFIIVGSNFVLGTFKTSSSSAEVLNQEGKLQPENIKGYMTISEVSKEFKIKPEELLERCELPKDTDLNKPLKDISKEFIDKGVNFETEKLREVVKELIK